MQKDLRVSRVAVYIAASIVVLGLVISFSIGGEPGQHVSTPDVSTAALVGEVPAVTVPDVELPTTTLSGSAIAPEFDAVPGVVDVAAGSAVVADPSADSESTSDPGTDPEPTSTSAPASNLASGSASPSGSAPITVPGPTTSTATDVVFVSSITGNDGNDGRTAETPWRSLQSSINRLQPGQTLYVMDGDYSEQREPGNPHYVVNVSGKPGSWIHIAAAPGHRPRLVPRSGNGISILGDYIEVSGLRIDGETFDAANSYGWGILVRSSHHVRLTSNVISDMPVGGISAVESTNLEIYRNEVFGNSFWGTEQGSGISIWHSRDHGTQSAADGYHDKIIGNIIYGNENKVYSRWAPVSNAITDGNGIIIDEASHFNYQGRTLIANNVVFDNGARGIIVWESAGVDVVFNTTFHNGRTAALTGARVELAVGRSTDCKLLNNVAWSRPGLAALTSVGTEKPTIGGNVFITDTPSGHETSLDLVTTADPGMVAPSTNRATADFHLVAGSILEARAVDIGPRVAVDAGGGSRPAVGADVGAYELGAS
ncbi:MAG: DUF1565 domain-containing protein [Actinomycetia bacterium]|nr:DUF1565 domain-containing protein [Actinomycetes bacterium]